MIMTSNKKLSITNRNRILTRICRELGYVISKSPHIQGYDNIIKAQYQIKRALEQSGKRI